MKNMFKRVIASLIAVTSLSVCTVSNLANATDTQLPDTSLSTDGGASARGYHTFYLTNTGKVKKDTISGPRTVDVYADPDGGSVDVYYKKQGDSDYIFVRSFDQSGNTPTATVVLSSGIYDFYVSAPYASSSNPISGYLNIN